MGDVVRTLKFAVRKRQVLPRGNKRLWVTEFAWFSNPPGLTSGSGQQLGVPLNRHAEYLSESVYRLWRLGFSAFVWYSLEDHDTFPSGLFSGSGSSATPKPAFAAFQLPFYADHGRGGVLVWGIAPQRSKTTVRIERRSGNSWRRVVDLSTDRRGVFYDRVRGSRGTYRAVAASTTQAQEPAYTDPSRPFKAR